MPRSRASSFPGSDLSVRRRGKHHETTRATLVPHLSQVRSSAPPSAFAHPLSVPPLPPPRSRMPPLSPSQTPTPSCLECPPFVSCACASLSPSPTHPPPSRRDTMRLPVRWRRKGPRRRPSCDRRSKGRDPGAMADLPHRPRPRPSLKKRNTPDRTNEGPRKQRGAFDFRRRGVSIYFSQLSLP